MNNIADILPQEVQAIVNEANLTILPAKSRDRYEMVYEKFLKWKCDNGMGQMKTNEAIMLGYFNGPLKHCAGSTMWSTYSMLKSTIYLKESNIDLGHYNKLKSFLKRKQETDITKKSKILTKENVEDFLNRAEDENFLLIKVR